MFYSTIVNTARDLPHVPEHKQTGLRAERVRGQVTA